MDMIGLKTALKTLLKNSNSYKSMLKPLDYAREAQKKTGILPLILIFNTSTISKTVLDVLKNSKIEGCRQYPCHLEASQCLIFSKQFVGKVQNDDLNPLTAVGLFLAEGERSLALIDTL